MFKTAFLSFALPFVLLAACGGDDSSTRSTAEIQAEWGQHCDAFASCTDGRDAAECKAEFPCLQALLRPDMLDKAVACEHARTCGTGDDACYSTEIQGITPSAAADSYESACNTKRTSCTAENNSFADDYCVMAGMFKDSIIGSLQACLDQPCTDIRTCFQAATVVDGCPSN
jgi:hypothetical protein